MSSTSASSSSSTDSSANGGGVPSHSLYEHFLSIREDVLRHKWLRSEEAGEDVGFEAALVDWMENHLDEEKKLEE